MNASPSQMVPGAGSHPPGHGHAADVVSVPTADCVRVVLVEQAPGSRASDSAMIAETALTVLVGAGFRAKSRPDSTARVSHTSSKFAGVHLTLVPRRL